eukprot:9697473-Alexandrium_andersonii.AAC.1
MRLDRITTPFGRSPDRLLHRRLAYQPLHVQRPGATRVSQNGGGCRWSSVVEAARVQQYRGAWRRR